MRPVVMLNRISLDSFFAGPNGEIDWFIPDPEVDRAAHGAVSANTVLFGRLTYQMFEAHWPQVARDPDAPEGARRTAAELNQMNKVVFSHTLTDVTWENSRLSHADPVAEVRRLKEEDGAAIIIFGAGTIVQALANAGLIDDYLLIVTPVVLGRGKPLFKDVDKLDLELIDSQSFKSGNVLLHYKPSGA